MIVGAIMTYKIVNSREDIQTRKKGFFSKKQVVEEKKLPNLQEILMIILTRGNRRTVRFDTNLEPVPDSYVQAKLPGDIVDVIIQYENQHKQKDRMYIIPNKGLDKDERAAIKARTQVDDLSCKTWKDFVNAYENLQSKSL